jgi:DNA-binding GntR family transcriptional regulator
MKRPQLKSDITSDVRQAIREGRYMPNERLIEAELAATFKTNRANVRTALARLEQEGLVTHEPNRGARVRVVSDEEALEMALARGALEKLLARQAASLGTKEDRKKLTALLATMRAAHKANDLGKFSKCNTELHGTIRAMAANRTVSRMLDGLLFSLVRLQYRAILLPGRVDDAMSEHDGIIKAICDSDPDAAEAAMQRHFDGVIDGLRRAMDFKKMGVL